MVSSNPSSPVFEGCFFFLSMIPKIRRNNLRKPSDLATGTSGMLTICDLASCDARLQRWCGAVLHKQMQFLNLKIPGVFWKKLTRQQEQKRGFVLISCNLIEKRHELAKATLSANSGLMWKEQRNKNMFYPPSSFSWSPTTSASSTNRHFGRQDTRTEKTLHGAKWRGRLSRKGQQQCMWKHHRFSESSLILGVLSCFVWSLKSCFSLRHSTYFSTSWIDSLVNWESNHQILWNLF